MKLPLQAIIFDMDGVLIASEPILTQICIDLFAELGARAVPSDFVPYIGTGEEPFIRGVAEKHGLTYTPAMKQTVYDIYMNYLAAHDCELSGTRGLFALLKQKGLRAAIASSADRIKLLANITAAGLRPDMLEVITAGDDVTHRKPHPEIYTKTVEALGLSAEQCLVIEDATAGIAAARAAGIRVIGLPTTFTRQQLLDAGAMEVAADLPALEAWLREHCA